LEVTTVPRRIDFAGEQDMDALAEYSYSIAEKLRDEDPHRLFEELTALAQWHPAKAAQVVMTLAAWFDPNVTTALLWNRVEGITEDRREVLRRTA
jgi:hypothetical protein